MRRVKIAELKDKLSAYLRAVEAGEEVEVTDRDRPIARIVPISTGAALPIAPAARPFREVRNRRVRPAGWTVDSLDLLLEERRER